MVNPPGVIIAVAVLPTVLVVVWVTSRPLRSYIEMEAFPVPPSGADRCSVDPDFDVSRVTA